jgi:hypothetical protein
MHSLCVQRPLIKQKSALPTAVELRRGVRSRYDATLLTTLIA